MKPITILLADDHTVVREGLRALLMAEADLAVVGEAQNGRLAVELTKKLRPAVVVMDLAMPQLNGLEATRQILLAVPATKVLILSAHNDDEYVECVIAAGAAGYLLKQSSAHILAEAIRAVEKGRSVFRRNDCFNPCSNGWRKIRRSTKGSGFWVHFSGAERLYC